MADDLFSLDRLHYAITARDDEESENAAKKAIEEGLDPLQITDTAIRAIEEVGRDFEEGRVYLPELMLAGLGMEKVMSLCQEKLLELGQKLATKGTLIIGTVSGDIHNIGKDLVISMWRAKGFEVHDLGVDVSASRFVSAAKDFNADIVALSALMSTTLIEQKAVMELFETKGIRDRFKIIVGGGVCTQEWADEIGADGYAEDATRAVKLIETLL